MGAAGGVFGLACSVVFVGVGDGVGDGSGVLGVEGAESDFFQISFLPDFWQM